MSPRSLVFFHLPTKQVEVKCRYSTGERSIPHAAQNYNAQPVDVAIWEPVFSHLPGRRLGQSSVSYKEGRKPLAQSGLPWKASKFASGQYSTQYYSGIAERL